MCPLIRSVQSQEGSNVSRSTMVTGSARGFKKFKNLVLWDIHKMTSALLTVCFRVFATCASLTSIPRSY